MLRSVGIVQQKSQELQKAMRDGFRTTNHARPLCILAVGRVRNNNYDHALERKNKGQEADLHMRRDKIVPSPRRHLMFLWRVSHVIQ
jgi:hypothetical protein